MRFLVLGAVAAAMASAAAAAPLSAPATVSVAIAPKLEQKAIKTYGVREIDQLSSDLKRQVSRELDRTGALAGGRVELTLVDVKPNRPTFKQLGDTPGLSMRSFGVGGAKIEGRTISADGTVKPVSYQWYETDIHQAWGRATWGDADYVFQHVARQIGRDAVVASR
jgi:hypothetical protein